MTLVRYARIVDRIFKDPSVKEDAARLLGWLVCAQRPLKWHEIQGAISIDLEAQDVDFEERGLRVDSKDLCSSLVEKGIDGSVELVHLTAKLWVLACISYFNSRNRLLLTQLSCRSKTYKPHLRGA